MTTQNQNCYEQLIFDEKEYKKKLRAKNNHDLFLDSLFIGVGILISIISANFIYNFLYLITGFSALDDGTAYYECLSYLLSITASMLFSFWLVSRFRGKKCRDIVMFENMKASVFIGCTLLCIFGSFAGNVVSSFLVQLIPPINNPILFSQTGDTTGEFLINMLYSAAIPALVEEFCFRGVLLGMLRRYGTCFAVVASSALFGIIHGNFVQMPFAFVIGLFFAIADITAESIWPSIVAHFLNNGFSVAVNYFNFQSADLNQDAITLAVYVITLVLGLIGIIMVEIIAAKRRANGTSVVIKTKEHIDLPSAGNKFTRFWLCPTIIVVGIYYFINALRLMI